MRLGRALHEAGFAAPALEGALGRVAARLGVPARFFITPTSIFSAFGTEEAQRVHLERVEPSSVDLGRLSDLDRLLVAVERGGITPQEGAREIERAAAAPPRYGATVTALAYSVSSAATAIFLGGGPRETAAGAVIGLLIGVLARLVGARGRVSRVFELLAATAAAATAVALSHAFGGLSVSLSALAGIILLIPGFSLTVALSELAERHLASGTARFAGALVVFLVIGFGAALGTQVGTLLFGATTATALAPQPPWAEPLALLVAPLSLTVLLRAPFSEAPYILLSGALGYGGGRLGGLVLSPELGAVGGALAVGLFASAYARWRDRPESIPLVPGILLLVPGSIGFRSFSELFASDVVPGLESAFRMLVVAISLVAGLLAANVFAPVRRR